MFGSNASDFLKGPIDFKSSSSSDIKISYFLKVEAKKKLI